MNVRAASQSPVISGKAVMSRTLHMADTHGVPTAPLAKTSDHEGQQGAGQVPRCAREARDATAKEVARHGQHSPREGPRRLDTERSSPPFNARAMGK